MWYFYFYKSYSPCCTPPFLKVDSHWGSGCVKMKNGTANSIFFYHLWRHRWILFSTFYTIKKTGESHRTHCDLWFKCYNPKLTFSTIIREYETCEFSCFFLDFWSRFEVELAIKTDENDIFIVLCFVFCVIILNDTRFFSTSFAVHYCLVWCVEVS